MTQCNGCGGCCDPVALPLSPLEISQLTEDECDSPLTYRWLTQDLTVIKRREGLQRANYMSQGGKSMRVTKGIGKTETEIVYTMFYECRHYDAENRECTNYENRPPMCSGYPWYDQPVDKNKALPDECEFRLDQGEVPVKFTKK